MPDKNGYIDPDFPNPMGPNDATIIIYGYTPNIALTSLTLALFALLTSFHLIQTVRHRTPFTTLFILASSTELLGYVFHTLSTVQDPYRIAWFVAQYFLIVTAPILTTAGMYICLSKLLAVLESTGVPRPRSMHRLTPRALLWAFVAADIATTAVQVTGAALIGVRTSRHADPATANDIVLAGIAIQTASFLVYLGLLTLTLVQAWRHRGTGPRLARFGVVLWVASVLVLLRLVFRLAESGQGVFGYAMVHEAFFGAVEFAPVVGAWCPGWGLGEGWKGRRNESGR